MNMFKDYEKFFQKTIKDAIKGKEQDEKKLRKIQKHTQRVVKLCHKLYEKLNNNSCNIKYDLLISAAWIHDIGKTNEKNIKGLHHLSVVLGEMIPIKLKDDDVFGIIEQHKGIFNPKRLFRECAILRLCDKIDKFYDDEQYNDAKEKCEKVIDEIVKTNCFESDSDIKILIQFFKKRKNKAKKRIKDNNDFSTS